MTRRALPWLSAPLALFVGCADDPPAAPTDVPPAADVADATAVDAPADAPVDAGERDVFTPPAIPDASRCGADATPWPTRGVGACELTTPPTVAPGACTATVNRPLATRRANELDGDARVLITGQRIAVAADRLPLPGYPMSMLRIPGTTFTAISDGGFALENLRIVDTAGARLAVTPGGEVPFPSSGGSRAGALFYGLAYDSAARVLYAAGGGANRIYAFGLSATGALTADPTRTLDLGFEEQSNEGVDSAGRLRSAFPAGIALSDDGTELYAAMQRGHAVGVFSIATRMLTRVIPVLPPGASSSYPYVLVRRPGDARHLYVSLWGASAVAEVDLTTSMPSRYFAVGKNPTEMVFNRDGSRLWVTATDEDAVAEIDLASPMGSVRTRYLGGSNTAPRGISPTAIALGADDRLYVTAKDDNAVDVFDSATFARVGRIPTEWQPTDVDLAPDGRVLVITGRGFGKGPNLTPGTTDVTDTVVGSVARYEATADALTRGTSTVEFNNRAMRLFNDVQCPMGAPYDFPVPRIGSSTPSTRIRHVILVIRENKTYDAVLGDYPGPDGDRADGDPSLTLVPGARMATVFPNLRALVRRFVSLDNYYIPSELSNQGHSWTTAGRGTDFLERTWMLHDGRSTRGGTPLIGTAPIGIPAEGDIFTAMRLANVRALNWGEIIGTANASQRALGRYPGNFFNNDILDTVKARAFLDTVLGSNLYGSNPFGDCDLPAFTYILLPNDHTQGGAGGRPTPVSHYQDNDEATGLLIDAVSHSTAWPETLIAVIEDDPAQGGDHVDNHRTLALLASPWVRRGGVSHVLYNASSLHHTIELILGVPAHNAVVAASAPMYDAFTNTPDFTPYSYQPRLECETRNPSGGRWAELTSGMDLTQPDHAPGLDRLVWQMLHDGRPPPWAPAAEEEDDDDD